MDALVVSKPGEVGVRTLPDPAPGPGEVLIEVAACGVCGTDRHIAAGTYPAVYPAVLGHEFAGTIGAVGDGVFLLKAGDQVAIDPNIPCHQCAPCRRGDIHLCERLQAIGVTRAGGMARWVVVPQAQAYLLPARLSTQAAAFAEPLSCIIHGLERVRVPLAGSVAILGAGSIGLLLQQAVRAFGAASVVVSEPSRARRDLAEQLGADEVYTPDMMEHASHSDAYDLVVDCTGNSEVAASSVRLARRGADILLFGVAPAGARTTLEPYELYRKELRLTASNINPFAMQKALDMIASGLVQVDRIVSQRVGLEDLPALLLAKPSPDEVKIALTPDGRH
ncbi:MAG: zinc-dependent alcohol dehydrogenase family protein [Candidatus Eremiobacteraeota bacterium]|nr:zinc-dependent alcohol dehydrogenase family protein [Candidatus Eremiobacteraeota bacterium]